jgi:hypothetical protein
MSVPAGPVTVKKLSTPAARQHTDPEQTKIAPRPAPSIHNPSLYHPANTALRADAFREAQQQQGNQATQKKLNPPAVKTPSDYKAPTIEDKKGKTGKTEALPRAAAAQEAAHEPGKTPEQKKAPEDEPQPTVLEEGLQISDDDAVSAALMQWKATLPGPLDPTPAAVAFTAELHINLELPKPPQANSPAAPDLSLDAARKEASAGYESLAGLGRNQHDEILFETNQRIHEAAMACQEALRQLDDNELIPALNAISASTASARSQLDAAAQSAEASLDEQSRNTRRQISAAAGGAKARITKAEKDALDYLPIKKAEYRARFEQLYEHNAKTVEDLGEKTATNLSSEKTRDYWVSSIMYFFDPIENAMKEARRDRVPGCLASLANASRDGSKDVAKSIRDRMGQEGSPSIAQNINDFILSMRAGITGEAFKNQKAGDSLAKRGHRAVDSAYSQTIHALDQQLAAARKAVRHAHSSGLAQCSTQRSAAIARLTSLRAARVAAIHDAAASAIKTLREGARLTLPVYADSARRAASSLDRAAANGPVPLTEMARGGLAGATKTLLEGQPVQIARLTDIATGARDLLYRQPVEAAAEALEAKTEFEVTLRDILAQLTQSVVDATQRQTDGFYRLASNVARAADSFTQPIPEMYKDSIEQETAALDQAFDGKAPAKPGLVKPAPAGQDETSLVRDIVTKITDALTGYVKDPLHNFEDTLNEAARKEDEDLLARANKAKNAWGIVFLDKKQLMAAFRGLTKLQGIAIRVHFRRLSGGGVFSDLDLKLQMEHDQLVGGLDDDQYDTITKYLAGDTPGGALSELKTTHHWILSDEGGRAEEIERFLIEKGYKLKEIDGWAGATDKLRGGLHGVDLKVFEALENNKVDRANAWRYIEAVDKARLARDVNALIEATRTYTALNVEKDPQKRLEALQIESAHVLGQVDLDKGEKIDAAKAASIVKEHATREIKVVRQRGGKQGGTYTETFKLDEAEKLLVDATVEKGADSKEAMIARMLREATVSGKPSKEAIQAVEAIMFADPRLGLQVTKDQSPEEQKAVLAARDAARKEQDDLLLAVTKLGNKSGLLVNTAKTADEARAMLADKFAEKYGKWEPSELTADKAGDWGHKQLGSQYVRSLLAKDAASPDPALALRFAIVGAGTDEKLIHRTLQRMTRAEIQAMVKDYNRRFHADLYVDLGVYHKSWLLGDLSGDERLQVEKELMGVPINDRERAEVAMMDVWQQQKETGSVGKAINYLNGQSAVLSSAEDDLMQASGGVFEADPDTAVPVLKGGYFDDRGKYNRKGIENVDRFNRTVNFASAAAESYAAEIDKAASFVTTMIAIAGVVAAAVATVVTGGLASPLLMAGIAGATGLLAIGANRLIRGGRYGWEEALTDLGMTVVQMITAGVAQSLSLAARGGMQAVMAGLKGPFTQGIKGLVVKEIGNELVQTAGGQFVTALKIGAATGGIGGFGAAALDKHTWENGIGEGIGNVLESTFKSAAVGTVTAGVTHGLEQGTGLGKAMQKLATSADATKSLLAIGGRGLGRGLISFTGGVAGRTTELLWDSATGKYKGSMEDAYESIKESGGQALLQGVAEGAGEAKGQRIHNEHVAAERALARPTPARGPDVHEPAAPPPMKLALPDLPEGVQAGIRFHPPDPAAPAGSPARNGWTYSVDFGPYRMTPEGHWFDTRFAELPGGHQVETNSYAKSPEGEWIEAASRKPIADPEFQAALNQWEKNMTASRLPAVADSHPPAADGLDARPRTQPEAAAVEPKIKPTVLSPQDHGWLAEIESTANRAKQLAEPAPDLDEGQRARMRAQLEDDVRRLAGEMGITGESPQAQERRTAALRAIAEGPARKLVEDVTTPKPRMEPVSRTEDKTAAGVAGTSFTGTGAREFGLPPVSPKHVNEALSSLLEGLFRGRASFAGEDWTDGITLATKQLDAKGEPVNVKLRFAFADALDHPPDEKMPVAAYDTHPDGDGYLVRISRGAPAAAVERALAHELTEIRAAYKPGVTGEVPAKAPPYALAPRAKVTKDTVLSPHDEGRLAEVDVLARKWNELEARTRPLDDRERIRMQAQLLDETQRLAAHLGLTGESSDVLNRRDLALRGLGEGPGRAFLENAIKTAGENPFLQRLTGDVTGDLELLAKRLEHAQQVGGPGYLRWQVLEIATQVVERAGVLLVEPMPPEFFGREDSSKVGEWKKGLPNAARVLLDQAVDKATKRMPWDKIRNPAAIDPYTAEWARTTFADRENFQDWSHPDPDPTKRGYLERFLDANPTVDITKRGELRRIFQKWAEGNFVGPTGLPRSVLSQWPDIPAHIPGGLIPREDLSLAAGILLRVKTGRKGETVLDLTVEEAAQIRSKKIAEAYGKPVPGKALTPDALQTLRNEINYLSEAFGEAAGLEFVKNRFPEAKVVPLPRKGAGVPDILIELPGNPGKLVVIECKGGKADLGSRQSANGMLLVEQGTKEYLESLAKDMIAEGGEMEILGKRLRSQLATESDFPEYYLVQQPFTPDGKLLPPLVGKFGKKP